MLDVQSLLNTPGVSLLTYDDEHLFRATFSNHGSQYAHSWLYILRAAHINDGEMGYKYVSRDLVATIGYRHDHLYITPLLDSSNGVNLQELCDTLSKMTHAPILIKKILPHQATPSMTRPEATYPLEDDTCPETVIHLQKLFTSDDNVNPQARKLARRAKAFERLGLTFRIHEDIKDIPFEKIDRFLARDPEKRANYLPIIRYLYQQPTNNYKYRVMVFMHRGRVRGLYIGEILSLTELGLYGAITSKDAGGITEWMDIYFFKKLLQGDIKTLYLGGAESEGIAEYIKKLLPYRPSYFAQTLLYAPIAAQHAEVTIRPVHTTDFNDLAALYCESYNTLHDLGETWTKDSAHRFISHFYRRQPDLFFLAEHNGIIVGAIVAAIQPWWDGNHLVEGEVFIHAEYRHTTLNKQLLKTLLTEARDTYNAVAWDTLTPVTDKHPLASYKEIGFSEVPQWAAVSGEVRTVLERLGV
ncbi:MAG TPA: GNAT family N-acetyltransferase [Candidatus Saccharimonadales bacterium]|nr:GNAT family N-acetyltransferase [Candidatus Saccharimonadales bacterium]